jgi:hypothetical protein
MGGSDAAGTAAEGAVPGVSLLCKEELAQDVIGISIAI